MYSVAAQFLTLKFLRLVFHVFIAFCCWNISDILRFFFSLECFHIFIQTCIFLLSDFPDSICAHLYRYVGLSCIYSPVVPPSQCIQTSASILIRTSSNEVTCTRTKMRLDPSVLLQEWCLGNSVKTIFTVFIYMTLCIVQISRFSVTSAVCIFRVEKIMTACKYLLKVDTLPHYKSTGCV